jgi:2-oxo-4-hydroxy-4-carboxy-5-ureidoimidazoline decarboxylase
MDGLSRLNSLAAGDAREELRRCCGARRWVDAMLRRRPFADEESLLDAARECWRPLGPADWREAFAHHPRIGGKDALRARFAGTRAWSQGEQSGVETAPEGVLDALAEGNDAYEARFGRIFIVCATGKSASEMLALLRDRLANDPDTESRIAAGEQEKITRIRLEKLIAS